MLSLLKIYYIIINENALYKYKKIKKKIIEKN